MSCTHDCGCTPEIRDARTDEWVQIAPESARAATLTPERPVKAPGQGGDIFLTRGKPVEVEWPTESRLLYYVDEGGYQLVAEDVGNGSPYSWGDARIVRVLTEDKPAQEPVLPRRIEPEDVRSGWWSSGARARRQCVTVSGTSTANASTANASTAA
jgi:hypothetical protein